MQMSVGVASAGQQLGLVVTVVARGAVALTFFFFLPVTVVLRVNLLTLQRVSAVVFAQAGQLSVPHLMTVMSKSVGMHLHLEPTPCCTAVATLMQGLTSEPEDSYPKQTFQETLPVLLLAVLSVLHRIGTGDSVYVTVLPPPGCAS